MRRWVLVLLAALALFGLGEWLGEDLRYTPPLLIWSIYSVWPVALVVILAVIWMGFGRERRRIAARFGILVLLAGGLVLGLSSGSGASTRGFNECVERGEEVRSALSAYRAAHGRYPKSLRDLPDARLPGSLPLRGNVLTYESNGASYYLWFRDWLVRHDATDRSPFLATK